MASAVKTAHLAIIARIDAQWGTTTDIAWPNVDFSPPDDEQWLKVDILWGDAFLETMEATASNRIYGVVQFSLFGPQGEGYGAMMTNIDTLRDILNRWSGSGVSFGATSGPAELDDEQYAGLMVSTPFDVVDT
jgi:hypothetical protein